MRLPLPYVLLGAVLAALGIYFYGHHVGWAERDADMQLEIARKNTESRDKEAKLQSQLVTTSTQLTEANDVVTKKQSDLDRAIRAGRVRFPAPRCVQAGPGAAAPAGDWDQARGQPDRPAERPSDADEADRQTLAAIAAIVAQGDKNTAQLNACIDAYNQVRDTLNDQRSATPATSH